MPRYFPTQGGTFDVSTKDGAWSFFKYVQEHPEDTEAAKLLALYLEVPAVANHYREWQEENARINAAKESGSVNDYYYDAAASGTTPSSTMEKAVDNDIARENVSADQDYQTSMRDTSLLSAADQLSQLGLSTSNIIQTGGAQSGVSSAAASQNMHSAASLKQQERMNIYNNKMGIAKSLISAASSMASSGIYGAALGAVKSAGAKIAGAAAHSAFPVVKDNKSLGLVKHSGVNQLEGGDNVKGYLLP